ncbi:MAG: cryptochrome/photolyase family protein [Myxococcota bacterium]
MGLRNLVLILGDQLDLDSRAFEGWTKEDAIWMAEVEAEIGRSHQLKTVFFLSAMRHFAAAQDEMGRTLHYHRLTTAPSKDRGKSFAEVLAKDLEKLKPEKVVVVLPGDYRVLQTLQETVEAAGLELDVRSDDSFYTTPAEFSVWAKGKKELTLEFFYRKLRKDRGLMMQDGKPVGGAWNFDKENRASFGKSGPPADLKELPKFKPDAITQEVMALVQARFADAPGDSGRFALPVTRKEALRMLRSFITHGLPSFGKYQDAMAKDDVVLYHSRVSALLNVKLLKPSDCVDRAIAAWQSGDAPLNSVEGFVRQILGWREFIRGIYWHFMPEYAKKNALDCEREEVPSFFWDGQTDMACVAASMKGIIELGYAHHIHRLMVMGLFAQLADVHPHAFHRWHMDMYVDAVDWVSLPNTLGMSQYGDGGIVGTKPYVATGKYIDRMGPYCKRCSYDPKEAATDQACPFTTLYWDFLARHRKRLAGNQRLALQLKNVDRKKPAELSQIQQRAQVLKTKMSKRQRI